MAAAAKQRADAFIAADVGRASTLPANLYTDSAQLEREREKIFARTWQVVGRSQQVAKPGDYFTTELLGEPLLLVRDGERRLRGFYNVCRHRAGPPAAGCGSRKVFRCGYHGWTYGLDGRLLSAPEMEGVEDFDTARFGLVSVRAEEWSGLVFVNLDEAADPLLSALAELPQQAARYGLERLRFYQRRDYIMQCNWKAYIDNYLEGYHLPSVHPSLNRELDYGDYVTHIFRRHSLQTSSIRSAAAGDGSRRYPGAAGKQAAEYYWMFPNWMLNCYPDNVSLNIVLPLSHDRTLAIFEWYFPEGLLHTDVPERTVRFSDEIQLEDGRICEAVQRNLQSRSYSRGRYSVKQEKGVHHFHRLYAEAMGM